MTQNNSVVHLVASVSQISVLKTFEVEIYQCTEDYMKCTDSGNMQNAQIEVEFPSIQTDTNENTPRCNVYLWRRFIEAWICAQIHFSPKKI